MTKKQARNLFIFGSLFFFVILLILTVDTIGKLDGRAPAITEKVTAGKKVWHKYDCIGCHTILGNGSYFAPDMTKVTERKPVEYLKRFLSDPKSVNPNAFMPKLGISDKEIGDLMAFLEWISKVNTNNWPPKPILATAVTGREMNPGQVVYQNNKCSGCHAISGIGGTTAPDLTNIGARRDAEWLIKYLKDPKSVIPGSAMPPFGHLSEKELKDLTDYMVSLK